MTSFFDKLRRVPRPVWFVTAAAIQIVLVAAMVVDRAAILRSGTSVLLETRPVDPRDFLRGDYVVLNYQISNLDAGALEGQPAPRRKGPLYVRLAPTPEGFHRAVSAHVEPFTPGPGEVMIQAQVESGDTCDPGNHSYCQKLWLRYGLESYFVPEGEGRAIEHERNAGKVTILAAVAPSGRAAIRSLLIDGKPVYEEPMF